MHIVHPTQCSPLILVATVVRSFLGQPHRRQLWLLGDVPRSASLGGYTSQIDIVILWKYRRDRASANGTTETNNVRAW
jgi:hypothetical protein